MNAKVRRATAPCFTVIVPDIHVNGYCNRGGHLNKNWLIRLREIRFYSKSQNYNVDTGRFYKFKEAQFNIPQGFPVLLKLTSRRHDSSVCHKLLFISPTNDLFATIDILYINMLPQKIQTNKQTTFRFSASLQTLRDLSGNKGFLQRALKRSRL